MKRILQLNLLLATSLALMFLVSCAKDSGVDLDPKQSNTITLKIPNAVAVDVKSVPSSGEMWIYDGYIFVCNAAGDGISYERFGEADVSLNGTSSPVITISEATMSTIKTMFKVVIVVNHTAENPITTAPAFGDISALFPLDESPLIDGDKKIKIPMYGRVGTVAAAGAAEGWAVGSDIDMKRAMAKVEVALGADVANSIGGANFIAANVTYKIYQYATRGQIAENTLGGVNAQQINLAPPVTVASDDDMINAITDVSYLYEHNYSIKTVSDGGQATAIANNLPSYKRLAIILKIAQTQTGESGFRYYRLDLYSQTTNTYLDLLRNNHYRFTINKATDGGYPTATEALMFPPTNIDYDITTDGDLNTTTSNSRYAINVKNRYDNYIGDTDAKIIMDASWSLGQTVEGNHNLTLPTNLGQEITVVENENISGAVLTVALEGSPVLSGTSQEVKWNVSGAAGKARITVRFRLGAVTTERTVVVELVGAIPTSYVFMKEMDIDLPADATITYTMWYPDATINTLAIAFNADKSKVMIPENDTPTGWTSGTATDYDSKPTFSVRNIIGTVETYTNKGDVKTRIDVSQPKPFYVGRSGTEITASNFDATMGDIISTAATRRYKRLIAGSHNEINLSGSVNIPWGSGTSVLYATPGDVAKPGNMNGWVITEDIRLNNSTLGTAAMYCYRRNGSAGDEIIKPTTWYLPALNQVRDMHAVYASLDIEIITPWDYWSSTESSETHAYYIYFLHGSVHIPLKGTTTNMTIRCVRDM